MLKLSDVHSKIGTTTTTIASGAALSAAIDLGGAHLVGIIMPATWTTADLTLQVSLDGQTFYNLHDVTIPTAASCWVRLDPDLMAGFNHIKLRSGTSGTPVNQAADRTLTLVARSI